MWSTKIRPNVKDARKRVVEDILRRLVQYNIPINIGRVWLTAEDEFKNHGEEYIKEWRDVYLSLCKEDGLLQDDWTTDIIFKLMNDIYTNPYPYHSPYYHNPPLPPHPFRKRVFPIKTK